MEKPITPTAIGNMSREELDAELMKGVESRERTPAYRSGSFLILRKQHYSSEELRRPTLSPQA